MVLEQLQDKENFDKDIQWAQWRYGVIEPLLSVPAEALELHVRSHARNPHLTLDGKKRTLTATTLWNWLEAYQRDGLKGLMRKYKRPSAELAQVEIGHFVPKSYPIVGLSSEHVFDDGVLEKLERTFSSLWEKNQQQAHEIQAAMSLLRQLRLALEQRAERMDTEQE